MQWALFVIVLKADMYYVIPDGIYPSMNKCFEAREAFMQSAPQPKINYEVVCVKTDQVPNAS